MLNVFTDSPQDLFNSIRRLVDDVEDSPWHFAGDGSLRFHERETSAKLDPGFYASGLTFRYTSLQKKSLKEEMSLRALLHSRLLELLATHLIGSYQFVVFEPRPIDAIA